MPRLRRALCASDFDAPRTYASAAKARVHAFAPRTDRALRTFFAKRERHHNTPPTDEIPPRGQTCHRGRATKLPTRASALDRGLCREVFAVAVGRMSKSSSMTSSCVVSGSHSDSSTRIVARSPTTGVSSSSSSSESASARTSIASSSDTSSDERERVAVAGCVVVFVPRPLASSRGACWISRRTRRRRWRCRRAYGAFLVGRRPFRLRGLEHALVVIRERVRVGLGINPKRRRRRSASRAKSTAGGVEVRVRAARSAHRRARARRRARRRGPAGSHGVLVFIGRLARLAIWGDRARRRLAKSKSRSSRRPPRGARPRRHCPSGSTDRRKICASTVVRVLFRHGTRAVAPATTRGAPAEESRDGRRDRRARRSYFGHGEQASAGAQAQGPARPAPRV